MHMKPLNILIPTDFSEISEKALQMTSMLAKKMPVNIHMLHVIESVSDTLPTNTCLSDTIGLITFQQEIYAASVHFNHLRHKGFVFDGRVSIGRLLSCVAEFVKTEEIDLVVMGTEGSEGIIELIAGSNAQQMVRHLEVPVITIKYDAEILALNDILFVSDFGCIGDPGEIELVSRIANTFNSTVHLLQIVSDKDQLKVDAITVQMTNFAQVHKIDRFQIHIHQQNQILKGVQNFNEEEIVDMVCIRTHGRKGISHLLFGSIAEKLVNRCNKPVLTFHLTP